MSFDQFGMQPSLLNSLSRQGLLEPMPVQRLAYPVIQSGKNVYIQSETGSGKTLAYLLPLYERIVVDHDVTQVLIVAPTHELALQIHRVSCDLAQNGAIPMRNVLLIGGTSIDRQIEKLKKKPQIVIGTPGRVIEMIDKGKLKVSELKTLVIDEADRLLGGDTLDKVRKIIRACPGKRQLVFVSATEQPESAGIIDEIAGEIVRLQTDSPPVSPLIEHLYLITEERDKPEQLRKLIHATQCTRAIVFSHRIETAETVAAKLEHHKIPVADLHGAYEKSERKNAMEDIRSGKARVLIASDVAARGLDIPGVTHVFNLDVPSHSKDYLHRVGRTARAGASGTAISLLTEAELRLVRRFERDLGISMHEISMREGKLIKSGS